MLGTERLSSSVSWISCSRSRWYLSEVVDVVIPNSLSQWLHTRTPSSVRQNASHTRLVRFLPLRLNGRFSLAPSSSSTSSPSPRWSSCLVGASIPINRRFLLLFSTSCRPISIKFPHWLRMDQSTCRCAHWMAIKSFLIHLSNPAPCRLNRSTKALNRLPVANHKQALPAPASFLDMLVTLNEERLLYECHTGPAQLFPWLDHLRAVPHVTTAPSPPPPAPLPPRLHDHPCSTPKKPNQAPPIEAAARYSSLARAFLARSSKSPFSVFDPCTHLPTVPVTLHQTQRGPRRAVSLGARKGGGSPVARKWRYIRGRSLSQAGSALKAIGDQVKCWICVGQV